MDDPKQKKLNELEDASIATQPDYIRPQDDSTVVEGGSDPVAEAARTNEDTTTSSDEDEEAGVDRSEVGAAVHPGVDEDTE